MDLAPISQAPSDQARPSEQMEFDSAALRSKFKESRKALQAYVTQLQPMQIMEITFLAGSIVSRNP